jgi:RimJ/RimL family protein N-acetyltransferase
MEKTYLPEVIEGEKVNLKKHSFELAKTMFEYVDKDRERLRVFLPWVDATKTIQDEENYIKFTHKQWDDFLLFDYGLFIKDTDTYTGNINVHSIEWQHNRCELGYWILGDFEGKGLISDAVKALEKVLFNIGFNRIKIRCDANNKRSGNVPKRCGFKYEGTLRQDFIDHNEKYRDTQVYSKIKSDSKGK